MKILYADGDRIDDVLTFCFGFLIGLFLNVCLYSVTISDIEIICHASFVILKFLKSYLKIIIFYIFAGNQNDRTIQIISGILSFMMPLLWAIFFFVHRRQSKAYQKACVLFLCIAISLFKLFSDSVHWVTASLILQLIYPVTSISVSILFALYMLEYDPLKRTISRWWNLIFLIPAIQFFFSGYVFYLRYPLSEIKSHYYEIINNLHLTGFGLAEMTNHITSEVAIVGLAASTIASVAFIPEVGTEPNVKFLNLLKHKIKGYKYMLSLSVVFIIVAIYYHTLPDSRSMMEWISGLSIFCFGYVVYKFNIPEKTTKDVNPKDSLVYKTRAAVLLKYFEEEKPYLNKHLNEDEIAKHLAMNTNYLWEVLHYELKTTFREFINSYRIEDAKRQLRERKYKSIAEVAENSGFNSMQTFHRVFHNIVGLPPQQYSDQFSDKSKVG